MLTSSVTGVVRAYRWQSLMLAVVTGFTAWNRYIPAANGEGVGQLELLFLILVLPLGYGLSAKPLLERATRIDPRDQGRREVERTWRDAGDQSVAVRVRDLGAFLGIIALAIVIAYRFGSSLNPEQGIGLTVALILQIIGLYLMTSKRDLMSQTVGLLVMDHGIYLAVVKIVAVPVPALFFVIGLWWYTAITLVILSVLVPQVRRTAAKGIALGVIADSSDLKG